MFSSKRILMPFLSALVVLCGTECGAQAKWPPRHDAQNSKNHETADSRDEAGSVPGGKDSGAVSNSSKKAVEDNSSNAHKEERTPKKSEDDVHAPEGGGASGGARDEDEPKRYGKKKKNNVASTTSESKEADLHEAAEMPIPSTLSGGISKTDVAVTLSRQFDELTEEALKQDKDVADIDRLVRKFRGRSHKTANVAKEAVFAAVSVRGFGPSKDGANIVLEQVGKLKNLAAAEYIRQRCEDRMHTEIVESTLQIAMGLDTADPSRRKALLDSGYEKLKAQVGETKATQALDNLKNWSKDIDLPTSAYAQPEWDVTKFQKTLHECTAVSMDADPKVSTILKKVKKYNYSKKMMGTSMAVMGLTEATALLAPGLFAPVAASLINSAFVSSTGGTEPSKMVNELYYAKAIESRWKRLNEETQMALSNYQLAVRTKSPTLLATSEAVLQQLIGSERVSQALGQSVFATTSVAKDVPIQAAGGSRTDPNP